MIGRMIDIRPVLLLFKPLLKKMFKTQNAVAKKWVRPVDIIIKFLRVMNDKRGISRLR